MSNTYWKGRTVIISGGQGFIGSHFVEELLLLQANVVCLYHKHSETIPKDKIANVRYVQIDLTSHDELQAFCRSIQGEIDTFIHCAALDGNTKFKLDHPAEILDVNNRLNSNVLKVCKDAQVKNVVLLSSAEIYSSHLFGLIKEEDDYHKQFNFTDNGYILSKVFSEILAEFYSKQFNVRVYIPRPTNVYGPRDSFDETTNRVIPSMIRKVSLGEKIDIWGDGRQTRSFIYVKDLIYSTLAAIENNITGPINMATRDQISILDLANYISKEYNAQNLIALDEKKPTGVKSRLLDVSKMYEIIDFTPLSIQEGLKHTIRWYNKSTEEK